MYKNFNKSARKAAVSAAAALMIGGASVAPAYAATQGAVGSSSTGTSVISVVVSPLARITAIDDVSFGTWSGSGALSATDDVCVWTTGGAYSITATGGGTGGAFTLADGSNEVSYSVTWDDVAGSSSGTSLTAGSGLSGQTSSATSTDCTGGSMTATLGVSIAEGDLSGAPSGNYSGTLTLVIAPE